MTRYLHVGGVIAMGFDASGEYLLVLSHSGRGVYSTEGWERVARDNTPVYPSAGLSAGIGPLEGTVVAVTEMNYATEDLAVESRNGKYRLVYNSGTIAITADRSLD